MLQRHVARTVAARFTEKTSPRSLRGSWHAEISAPTLRVPVLLMSNRKFARYHAFRDQLPSSWLQQKQGVRGCKLPVKRQRRQRRNTGSGYRRFAWTPPKRAVLPVLDIVLYILESREQAFEGNREGCSDNLSESPKKLDFNGKH